MHWEGGSAPRGMSAPRGGGYLFWEMCLLWGVSASHPGGVCLWSQGRLSALGNVSALRERGVWLQGRRVSASGPGGVCLWSFVGKVLLRIKWKFKLINAL